MLSSRSRSGPSGSASANATDTPPRNPPQVRIRMVPRGTLRQRRSSRIAGATVSSRDSRIATASRPAASKCSQEKGNSNSSMPINANSKALSMSSSSSWFLLISICCQKSISFCFIWFSIAFDSMLKMTTGIFPSENTAKSTAWVDTARRRQYSVLNSAPLRVPSEKYTKCFYSKTYHLVSSSINSRR